MGNQPIEELKSSTFSEQKLPFKLETEIFVFGQSLPALKITYYSSLKLLRQGSTRIDSQYTVIDERKYMLNDRGEYEPFVVFGKSAIGYSELKGAVQRLELEEQEKSDPRAKPFSRSIPKTWK